MRGKMSSLLFIVFKAIKPKGEGNMRKYQWIMSCLTVFLMLGFWAMAHAAQVIYVEGRVQKQSAGASDWTKLDKGMEVSIGDSIRTARNSLVDIALDEAKKNTVRIDEKTMVVLNSAGEDMIDRLDLSRGKVFSNLESIKAGLSFEVTTPSAVAGVRGSSYSVYVERDEDEVAALKDTVFIQAYDAEKNLLSESMLPQGFRTFIERFGEPSVFMPVAPREYRNFDRAMEDISDRLEGKNPERQKLLSEETGEGHDSKSGEEQILDQTTSQGNVLDEVSDTKDSTQDGNTLDTIQDLRHSEEEYFP